LIMDFKKTLRLIFYIFILTGSISLWSQERIGVAAAVDTVTTDLTLEQEKKLVDEGYKIIQNHTIETDENGKAQMLLVDGTAFTVGPNSSVTLDSFIYNPETAEGSLTVTSKGLMRLVGGKVTKNNPAIIRTNAATVGIRGGIVFVDSEGETTEASFIYGDEMTVTPALNQDGTYVLTRNGFVVVVDDPLEDVEDVSLLTADQLLAMQESLQGSPEEEEEETEEETSEESESEESEEEESEEESSEEESEEEGESEDESSEEESESEDESESEENEESSEESADESESSDSEADENSGSEDGSSEESSDSDNETEAQDTDNATDSDTNQDGVETDGDTDNEPEIDESALDSSGISDNSSDVEPDQLSTATDIDAGSDIDVAAETETESAEETEAVEDVSEVAQETVQDTAQQEDTAEAAEGTPLASALAGETTDSLSADITITPSLAENASNVSIGTIDLEAAEDNQVTVEISGTDSDKVVYNPETQEIILISGLDFEDDSTLDITVSISDELGNNQTDNFTIAVTNQNDAPSLVAVENNNLLSVNASLNDIQTNGSNISETTEIGAVVASVTVADQDGDALQYSLSGAGSENFAISSAGEISLAASLNFESQTQYTIEVTSTDGLVSMTEEITIYVVNDNEAPSLAVQDFSISEASSLNSVVATAVGNDPENTTISYSLSGGGDKFTIDNNGQITLTDNLDYENNTTYELTVFASDGFFSVPKIITVTITDANDAPSLSSSVAFNSFLENTAVGSTIATSTFSDPESDTLSFSLSGTGSDKFSVDADGKVTLASALDYESATSYSIALEATDGVNTVTKSLLINVGDVTELSYTGSLAANSQVESINTGTVILTSSVSNGQGSLTYSISDPDNKFAINSSTGEVTLDNALDFETKSSHSFTVSVTDGSATLSETFSVSVSDIDLSYSGSLASSSQSENISSGTVILNSSASNAEGTITYSITDADSKFAINSSTGQVTLANALDYETKTSHTFTVSANDGTTTTSTTFTLNVSDASGLSNLVATLANPSVAESGITHLNFSPGTAVASVSGLANELGGSPVYSITSGNEKNIFAVNSSTGAITTNIDLDFETAKSHTINLTATVGSDSTTTAITIPVKNARENNASLVRYSGGFHNASRSGLSATATRGHQAGAEIFEEVLIGLRNRTRESNQTNIREEGLNYAQHGSGVRLQYGHGVKENLDFYFPVYRSGDAAGVHAPNFAGGGSFKDGFYWVFGGATDNAGRPSLSRISTSIGGSSKTLSAGQTNHTGNGWHEFAFMTTQTASVVSLNFNIMEEDLRVFCMGYAESYCNNASGYFASSNLQTNSFMFDRTYTSEMASSSGSSLYAQLGVSSTSDNYLNRFNVIIDNREYVNLDSTSQSGMATDLDIFVDWMKLPSSLLYVKIYGDYRDDGDGLTESQLPQQTRKWIQAIGGDVEFSNNWNAGTGGYRRLGGTFASGSFYEGLNNTVMYVASPGPAILSATNGQPMYCGAGSGGSVTNFSNCMSAYYRAEDLGPGVHADLFIHGDISSAWGTGLTQQNNKLIRTWMLDKAFSKIDPPTGSNTPDAQVDSITYYKDMVTSAGEILSDSTFTSFTGGGKVVTAWVPIPIENTAAAGFANDYFFPAFIPIDTWKNMTVNSNDFNLEAANLCIAQGASWTCNNMRSSIGTYDDNYKHIRNAMVGSVYSEEKFYYGSQNMPNAPVGTSHLWQVLNDNGVGVGLYAQISVVHSSNTNRDDQQSLLNVVITQVDHRSNDTTRYSVGDTGMGMDGYHYWSFQDDTSSNSRGIHYGVGPIECATATEAGCFFGGQQSPGFPVGAMLTSSDPYKSTAMTLAVSYDSREDSFQVGTFNQAIVRQRILDSAGTKESPGSTSYQTSMSLSDFRSTEFYSSSASSYSGFFGGLLEFDVSGVGNGQLARVHSTSTLATFTFDATNDDVQVVAPMTVASAPSNNYTATWSAVDTGSLTLKFGDANNDQAKSAYISSEMFGAQIQDNGNQIDGSSGGSNNLAGVMVSWETIESKDHTLVSAGMPDCNTYNCNNAEYSTWGAWAMGSPDISPNAGDQNAAVHLGFWVAGDMLDQSEIPTSGSASLSGKAVFNVAYRHNQANSDYGVTQYSSNATVNGTFNWGSGSYSGQLDFTNFDSGNSLVSNAGFTSFSVSLAGSGATYAGSLNDTNNGWTREAVIAGALYGNNTPVESGGRISVGLSKSGSLGTSGANDFYMAEGIYLID